MISVAIVNLLKADASLVAKIGDAGIYAERGRGEKNVQVKTTTAHKIVDEIDALRHSTVQFIVRGWNAEELVDIAGDLVSILSPFHGQVVTNFGTFTVSDIDFRAFPTPVYEGEDMVISMNAKVYYHYHK